MRVIDHNLQPKEEWRPGVLTRMQASALTETTALCVFEQWISPGNGAQSHTHCVEEILTVLEGEAEVWLNDERRDLSAGQSVIVPAGSRHGFRNNGNATLHMQAILASATFEASYEAQAEATTRWACEKT